MFFTDYTIYIIIIIRRSLDLSPAPPPAPWRPIEMQLIIFCIFFIHSFERIVFKYTHSVCWSIFVKFIYCFVASSSTSLLPNVRLQYIQNQPCWFYIRLCIKSRVLSEHLFTATAAMPNLLASRDAAQATGIYWLPSFSSPPPSLPPPSPPPPPPTPPPSPLPPPLPPLPSPK